MCVKCYLGVLFIELRGEDCEGIGSPPYIAREQGCYYFNGLDSDNRPIGQMNVSPIVGMNLEGGHASKDRSGSII